MSATVLDGKAIAAEIRGELKTAVSALINQGVTPGLGVILVGEDPAGSVVLGHGGLELVWREPHMRG